MSMSFSARDILSFFFGCSCLDYHRLRTQWLDVNFVLFRGVTVWTQEFRFSHSRVSTALEHRGLMHISCAIDMMFMPSRH